VAEAWVNADPEPYEADPVMDGGHPGPMLDWFAGWQARGARESSDRTRAIQGQ
jgi:hypothetical protein